MTVARRRGFGFALVVAALVAALALVFGGGRSGAAPGRLYLALGDSVAFGYITQDGYDYLNPDNFAGDPGDVAEALGMSAVNAACPGETSGSVLSATAPDNGCHAYRASFPLHVGSSGTQLAFATAFLQAHPETRLVSVQLGANDAFLLEKACGYLASCIQAGLPALLASVAANLDTILRDLRGVGFHGVLMVVNYYSLDYADQAGTAATQALNAAVTSHAQADGAVVADAFTAFQQAAQTPFAGGDTCKAGLLNASPQNQSACDVHPSRSGQELLAQTIENTYNTANGN